MCVAVFYSLEKQSIIAHFTNVKAQLPIKTKTNQAQLITWGRRTSETGQLPLGGWIQKELLDKGLWNCFFPKKVKILVAKFMEHTVENQCEWFDVTNGLYIQGILLQDKTEQRVYIATMVPKMPNTPFTRWPILLSD